MSISVILRDALIVTLRKVLEALEAFSLDDFNQLYTAKDYRFCLRPLHKRPKFRLMESMQNDLSRTIRHLYAGLLDAPLLSPARIEGVEEELAEISNVEKESLSNFAAAIANCQNCSFYLGRKNLVFGKGQAGARVAFIGDLPSLEEDEEGMPFTGEAGELLQKMVLAMQLKPSEVYFATLFKCRPPANKNPNQEEFHACEKHLRKQINLIAPEIIVAFGEITSKALSRSEAPLPVLRKQEFDWHGTRVICTYHPRELLKNPGKKKEAWDDLKLVMRKLGLG